jgi:hypothetical protein
MHLKAHLVASCSTDEPTDSGFESVRSLHFFACGLQFSTPAKTPFFNSKDQAAPFTKKTF